MSKKHFAAVLRNPLLGYLLWHHHVCLLTGVKGSHSSAVVMGLLFNIMAYFTKPIGSDVPNVMVSQDG